MRSVTTRRNWKGKQAKTCCIQITRYRKNQRYNEINSKKMMLQKYCLSLCQTVEVVTENFLEWTKVSTAVPVVSPKVAVKTCLVTKCKSMRIFKSKGPLVFQQGLQDGSHKICSQVVLQPISNLVLLFVLFFVLSLLRRTWCVIDLMMLIKPGPNFTSVCLMKLFLTDPVNRPFAWAAVPKLGINYPPRLIWNSSGDKLF